MTWSAATPPDRPQVLGEAGIRAAIERSLDHYLHTVVRPLPVPPRLRGRAVRAGSGA